MSEASAQQNELKAQKRPKFVRQLSKSYEKGKEVVKRNLLTPRGPRTAKSAELPLPAPGVKTPSGIDSSPQEVAAPAEQKAAVGDAQAIKVDIKATHDNATPVELLVKPADAATSEVAAPPAATPASPADEPAAPAVPSLQPPAAQLKEVPQQKEAPELKEVPEPKEVPQAKEVPRAKAAPQPAQQEEEEAVPLVIENPPAQPTLQVAAQTDELSEDPVQTIIDTPADLGCAPPAVSVTITGAPGNAEEFHATDKPSRALSAPEKKGRGIKRAFIGLVAITAAGLAAAHARR